MLEAIQQAIGNPGPSDEQFVTENFPRTAKKSARARILVVDDESLIRWAIVETLADRGYDVSEAEAAASAIRACSPGSRPVDLVLLDLHLPDCADLGVLSASAGCRLIRR